jgi:outer membrane protein OmpA-like peptidoglycan-associated protein
MPTDPHRPHRDSPSSEGLTSLDEDWTQLRTLLLSPEQTQLDELRDRLDNRAVQPRDVSRVLPEAFAVRGERDPQLSTVLTPYVENGFVATIRKSPRAIVDAIAPILGPAIRLAIARALQGMTQSFNHSLDESLSVRGLRWRLEAWRTGRSFAEVVLLHTLRYRVEQVFLIHRETGLLLHHVAAEGAVVQDQQVLSGMLTAIQSYVRDSFGASPDQTLDHFRVGEWTVWIEQGSHAYLAGVVRGTPPETLREDFQAALDDIHAQQPDALTHFDGDAAAFKTTQTYLESCLRAHYEPPPRPSVLKLWILGGAVILLLSWWGVTAYQTHARWSNLLVELGTEPGMVVTVAKSTMTGYHLEGLRDPLAKDPSAMVIEAGLEPSSIKAVWSPYYSLDPQLVETRAHSMLHSPKTVKLSVEGDTLVATGSASIEWARETRRLATLVPGISLYRDEGLVTTSIPDLLERVNRTVVRFRSGSSIVEPSERAALGAVSMALRELDQAVSQSGQRVRLEVLGSTDDTGPAARNIQLSKERARAVLVALGGEPLGEATTTVIGDLVQSTDQRGSTGEARERRIVTLRATLTLANRENEAARP